MLRSPSARPAQADPPRVHPVAREADRLAHHVGHLARGPNPGTRPAAALALTPPNVAPLLSAALAGRLPGEVRRDRRGLPFQLHRGPEAATIAAAHAAEALTLDRHVFTAMAAPPVGVVDHELVHVEQQGGNGPPASMAALEREAAAPGRGVARLSAPAGRPLRHPALRVLLRGGRWLASRTTSTLSKHVARHGRNIAGRAIHSVFKNPRRIKDLVTTAVHEAAALARAQATRAAHEALEGTGITVVRQAGRTPGKFRIVIQKDFGKAIGTNGETAIRVVLDMSGRVVTAFPVNPAVLIGAVGLTAFTSHTAEAADEARAAVEAHEDQPIDWGEVAFELTIDIVSLGLLSSSPVNEGEDLLLRLRDIVDEAAWATIRDIEAAEGITLTDEQRHAIHELAEVAIGLPMQLEGEEDEEEPAEATPTMMRWVDGSTLDRRTGRFTLGPGPKL